MEEVDLSDNRGLIPMSDVVKATEAGKVGNGGTKVVDYRKDSSRISCSKPTAVLLFLIALAAIVLAAFVTFWVTRGIYDRSIDVNPFVQEEPYFTSTVKGVELFSEDDEEDDVTGEQLRLPKNLHPIWYNISIKPYLPGFVPFDDAKNLTFEAALIIKFRVEEATDKIVLSALNLNLDTNVDQYKILQESATGKVEENRAKRAKVEKHENVTRLENVTESANITESIATTDEEEEPKEERPNTTKLTKPKPAVKSAAHVQVKNVTVNSKLEMVTFELDGELRKGEEYFFKMIYSGPIDRRLAGMYLNQYKDDSGAQRYAAITQMEPTDARRMVPCFDEPEFKAIWKVRVLHPRGTRAVSNGIEVANAVPSDDPDWLFTSFKESLPMSPYLLAIAVCDFDFNEGHTSRGTRFRVWSRKEALNQTTYALESGIKALEYYENYYNISFPLEKQDLMAVPDFAAGAMENWGLVLYREKVLLYDERLYTPLQKMHVAVVIAHELAHQWFGNLVTMKWWDDLWLNEGFASYMEYVGADAISKGNFRMKEYFLHDSTDAAMRRDAHASSHPLHFPIDKAEDVSEAFDEISYDKGACIISMIEQILGNDNFRKGLNIYLERGKYGNAANKDLWSALNEVVPEDLRAWNGEKLDVADFAAKWTDQMGYPVVEVRRLEGTRIELHQRRFKWDESSLEKEKYRNAKYKYDIPIWYTVEGEEKGMEWLHEALGIDLKTDQLLVINSESRGFYRVNYNKECWKKIMDQLMKDHSKISIRSRARIIDDAFALAEAGAITYDLPLNMSYYLLRETEYLPWVMALSGFSTILDNFRDEPETRYVREFLEPLVAPLYEKVDWDKLATSYLDDKHFFENELQYEVVIRLCSIRNINCTERLMSLFKTQFLDVCKDKHAVSSECSRVPIPVRTLVYCEGVRQGAEKTWNTMKELYVRERTQVERDKLLAAMACSRDPFTLNTLLDLASDVNDTTVRLQDAPSVFSTVGGREVGGRIIFDYFQDNWPRIYKDIKDQQTLLRTIIISSTDVISERQINELEAFVTKYKKQTSKYDSFGRQLETTKTNKLWMDRNFAYLTKWFKENPRPTAVTKH